MDLLDLSKRTILITGGCGAIGRVVVEVLANHGASVVVNDIVPEDEARDLLGSLDAPAERLHYRRSDITTPEGAGALFPDGEAMPDVVCCHAGMAQAAPVEEYSIETFDRLFDLNVRGAFLTAQAASRRWLEAGNSGHLIFTSSWVQDVPWPDITPYNASKAGLKMLMRGFARELAPKNIRANAVAPGIVNVGMAKRQLDSEPDYRRRAERAIPLGHLQPPTSVAHAFLFLCSDMASYMTGSVLLVDGGASLYPMDGDE